MIDLPFLQDIMTTNGESSLEQFFHLSGALMEDDWERVVFTVSGNVVAAARKQILACEHCNPGEAEIPFTILLDDVMQFSGAHTDYILTEEVHCPCCGAEITEETLVEWE